MKEKWLATSTIFKMFMSAVVTSAGFLLYIFSVGLELGTEREVFKQLILEVRGLSAQIREVNHSLSTLTLFSEGANRRLDHHASRIKRLEDWQDRMNQMSRGGFNDSSLFEDLESYSSSSIFSYSHCDLRCRNDSSLEISSCPMGICGCGT